MSKFLNRPVRIVDHPTKSGKEGITVRFTDEERTAIVVRFPNELELAFLPSQLWFLIVKEENRKAA